MSRCDSISSQVKKQNLFISLLIGLILVQTASLQDPKCPEKDSRCMECDSGQCTKCANTLTPKLNGPKKECLDTKTTIPNCLVETEGESACQRCVNGYYPTSNRKSCVEGAIDGCVEYAIAPADGFTPDDFNECTICKKGQVLRDKLRKSCIAVSEEAKIPHCDHHILSLSRPGYDCSQCEKGYSIDTNFQFVNNICEKVSTGNEGCKSHKEVDGKQVCLSCRYEEDYFITRTGCKKVGLPDTKSNSSSGSNSTSDSKNESTSKFQERLSVAAFGAILFFSISSI